jgi:hypothetical protein
MLFNNKIKNDIIAALESDGFNVIDKKDFVVATKKENILYIRGLEDIQSELNFQYLAQQASLKNIGGVAVLEIKKLLTEAINKQIKDLLPFLCDKLNWSIFYTDSFIFNKNKINLVEISTDSNEIITMVFFNEQKPDKFFAVEMPSRKFVKLIDSLQYKDLQSLAPKLYQLVLSQ